MSLTGPIVIIEDDAEDIQVIKAAVRHVGISNSVIAFSNCKDGYDYLLATTDQPFFILCDIRMPRLNGLEFRKQIQDNEYLCRKSIPFIFYTHAVSQDIVNEAYLLNVQGVFAKSISFEKVTEQMLHIYSYWSECLHPNKPIQQSAG